MMGIGRIAGHGMRRRMILGRAGVWEDRMRCIERKCWAGARVCVQ